MKQYVLGLAFSSIRGEACVAMIQKTKGPADVVGKLNGIGGSIEKDEWAPAAMAREFEEETGLRTHADQWTQYLTMRGNNWEVIVFTILLEDEAAIVTKETELVSWVPVSAFQNVHFRNAAVSNVPWIVEMAMNSAEQNFSATVVYND